MPKLRNRIYLLGSAGAGASVTTTGGWHKMSRDKAYIQVFGTYVGVITIDVSGDGSTKDTILTLASAATGSYEVDSAAGDIRADYTHTSGSVRVVLND